MHSKAITVRISSNLIEHCNRRIRELNKYHDMDVSKFIRWLIKKDLYQYQSNDKSITPVNEENEVSNSVSYNNIQNAGNKKPPHNVTAWNFPK